MNSNYLKGFLLTALGVVILSFDAFLIRSIEVHSLSLLFWRGLLLSLSVFLWLLFSNRTAPRLKMDAADLRSAILYTISSICFVTAINLTSVANVLVIISAQPLLAAVMARYFLGEKTSLATSIAIVVSVIGIGWVMKDSWASTNLAGDFVALMCGLSISAKFVNDRAVPNRNMTPALIPAGLMIAACGIIGGSPLELQGMEWFWMLILCGVVIPAAFVLITLGPMRISAAEVGMLMLLETALGPVWVWLWLNETPSLAALQGGSLVIFTLILHGLWQWRKQSYQSI